MTSLQQYEHLFELVNDSVMTRTMEGRINFWNRSAEELYGWGKDEAIGKVSHDLLQTQFPKPLEEIESELVRNRRWEGRLVHTTRDGGRVVVESRWALEPKGQTGALVEINTPSRDYQDRAGAYSVEIGRQEPVFVHDKLGSVPEALSNVEVRRTVPTVKRTVKRVVRAALRKVRTWLEEDAEQPLHPTPIALCAKILEHDAQRPNYVWGVVQGTLLAQALEIPRISVLELGVAGGKGLIALEEIARKAAEICRVQIDVYGFDSGVGLPKPGDYRDLPNLFSEGFFPMDPEKLRRRLKKAKLKLGLVEETIPKFLASNPAPIAFIAFDLDLYSSTRRALCLLEADEKLLLPRIYCYFDDILGFTYSEFTGELLAISEFNNSYAMRKISKINGLRYVVPPACRPDCWVEQVYIAHIFDHKLYGHYDGSNVRTTLDLPADE